MDTGSVAVPIPEENEVRAGELTQEITNQLQAQRATPLSDQEKQDIASLVSGIAANGGDISKPTYDEIEDDEAGETNAS